MMVHNLNTNAASNKAGREPVYLSKAFHALCNRYDTALYHAIDAHSDAVAMRYSWRDPISSLSWGRTGVLLLHPARKKQGYQGSLHLVVQEDGDVNVMCGKFQERYLHSVPHVSAWEALLNEFGEGLEHWEVQAMGHEIAVWQQDLPVGHQIAW